MGKAKKKTSASSSKDKAEAEEIFPQPPRKRGRPKKLVIEEKVETEEEKPQEETEEIQPRQKVPKPSKQEEMPSKAAAAEPASALEVPYVKKEEGIAETTPRRGSRRKSQLPRRAPE